MSVVKIGADTSEDCCDSLISHVLNVCLASSLIVKCYIWNHYAVTRKSVMLFEYPSFSFRIIFLMKFAEFHNAVVSTPPLYFEDPKISSHLAVLTNVCCGFSHSL
jgi:hypothetical protein